MGLCFLHVEVVGRGQRFQVCMAGRVVDGGEEREKSGGGQVWQQAVHMVSRGASGVPRQRCPDGNMRWSFEWKAGLPMVTWEPQAWRDTI